MPTDPVRARVLVLDALPTTPWRNGRGVTRELGRGQLGGADGSAEPDWRLSVAEVAADNPFSAFPGLDRTLFLLSGPRLELDMPTGTVVLAAPGDHAAFPGEAAVFGRVPAGPTRDLNVFTRRAVARHEAGVLRLGGGPRILPAAPVRALLPLDAPCRVDGRELAPGSVLLCTDGPALSVEGAGRILRVAILKAHAG